MAEVAPVAVVAAVLVSVACLDWLGTGPPAEFALVGAEQGNVALVNLALGRVGTWSTRLPRYEDARARSMDGSTFYWSTFDRLPTHILLATDASSLDVLWRDSTNAIVQRSQVGPLSIDAEIAISPTPDGTRLLVADARRDTTTGIVVLDMATRDPVGFVPLVVARGGMTWFPPNAAYPDGAVIVETRAPERLLFLDGATLEIRDSVTPAGGLGPMIVSQDGTHLYVAGSSAFYEYDVVARQVVATGPRFGNGDLAISPDGQRLYQSDRGDFVDFPGSGKIFVYDAALNPLPPFDLSAASVDGVVPVTHGIVTSHDGTRLYVKSGTGHLGRGFGPQLGRLFVLDTGTGQIVSTIALGRYGVGWIILR